MQSMPRLRNKTRRALVACRRWLHIGFIGAATLAAGLRQLLDGEATWLLALTLTFCGGVLAAASWRRGLTILEHAERASAVATDASSESTSHASATQAGRADNRAVPYTVAIEPEAR